MPALTDKQDKFARLVARGESYAAAYRAAYDAENMVDATVYSRASELMADSKIAVRVDELRDAGAKKAGITVESALAELDELMTEARKDKTHGAAVRASELKGKLAGLYVEKTEDVSQNMSDEDLARSIAGDDEGPAYEIVLGLARGEPMPPERVVAIGNRYLGDQAEQVA